MTDVVDSDKKPKPAFVPSACLQSSFRNWIKNDETADFPAEANRYHVYVALACPWAHRVLTVLKLKGLDHVISYSAVDGLLDMESEQGWAFGENYPDPHHSNFTHLKDVYRLNDPNYNGRVTVPVLFDLKKNLIVNNESSEIVRMLNSEFNTFARHSEIDLYPTKFQSQIDDMNEKIFSKLNTAVYRAGFANDQGVYEKIVNDIFDLFDTLESILSKQRYIIDHEVLTETDIRAWTTLVRFDIVYVTHFKCNKYIISKDYPNLFAFIRELYQIPGVKDTVNIYEIKKHYYQSHRNINPSGIIAQGPYVNFDEPHGRDIQHYQ